MPIIELQQRRRHVVDGVFLVRSAGVAARQRGEFQVDQLVNHRELHVAEGSLEWPVVFRSIQDSDLRGLGA